jgi:hypothetical protein
VADEGVNLAVHALDLAEARLHGVARGNFAAREPGGEFGNGELVQHGIKKTETFNIQHSTFNIQHSTPNIELPEYSRHGSLDVGC